jgi:hypothetical protein
MPRFISSFTLRYKISATSAPGRVSANHLPKPPFASHGTVFRVSGGTENSLNVRKGWLGNLDSNQD